MRMNGRGDGWKRWRVEGEGEEGIDIKGKSRAYGLLFPLSIPEQVLKVLTILHAPVCT
jgi:hypothetical protein